MQPARDNWFIRLQKRYNAYVEREDKALFEKLKQADALQPRLTPGKATAFAIAVVIHGITILLPILGVAILITQFAGCFSICYTITFVGAAIAVRPRLNKPPEDIAKTEKFHALYRYVDQIADQLHAPRIDFIVINELYNAAYGRVGLRQSRLLTLGHPLWMHLTPQEQVALVAHEMAHGINGDFARNFVVGTAMYSLQEWYRLLYPGRHRFGLLEVLVRPVLWVMANSVLLWLLLLRHLLLLESRRAEYLADHFAATVAGTEATVAALKKMQDRIYKTLPITSHPPTAYRIAMLEAKPIHEAAIRFSEADMETINREMSSLDSEMTARIRQLRQDNRNYY